MVQIIPYTIKELRQSSCFSSLKNYSHFDENFSGKSFSFEIESKRIGRRTFSENSFIILFNLNRRSEQRSVEPENKLAVDSNLYPGFIFNTLAIMVGLFPSRFFSR